MGALFRGLSMERLNQKGFSLFEIVVATVLMAAAGAAMLSAFSLTSAMIQPQRQSAFTFIESNMDALRQFVDSATWDTASNDLAVSATQSVAVDTEVGGRPADTMTMTRTVSDVVIPGAPPTGITKNYKKVVMRVTW
jgi:type II secretory pathway pseudopilin PulG